MGEFLSAIPLEQIGAGTLVTITVLLVLTGRLVPRQHVLDVQANSDKWQASSEKWQQVATQHGMTLARLIDYAEAADHALTSIQQVTQLRRGEGVS